MIHTLHLFRSENAALLRSLSSRTEPLVRDQCNLPLNTDNLKVQTTGTKSLKTLFNSNPETKAKPE